MTSREFNQNRSRAMQAAKVGPVSITSRGKPAYVLMTEEEYRRLKAKPQSAWDALAPEAEIDIDLMDYIPPRRVEPLRFSFDDEE
jgi:prevent-host-death family protein